MSWPRGPVCMTGTVERRVVHGCGPRCLPAWRTRGQGERRDGLTEQPELSCTVPSAPGSSADREGSEETGVRGHRYAHLMGQGHRKKQRVRVGPKTLSTGIFCM